MWRQGGLHPKWHFLGWCSNSPKRSITFIERVYMTTFRNFEIFSPVNFQCWGEFSGSEKSEKSQPESGFQPEHFFQNSTIFSNNSHSCHHRGPFIGRKECTLPYMVILPLTEATLLQHLIYVTYYYKETNFEKKVWMETQYGVKIFQNFHFQKHSPTIQKRWAKKKFKKLNCLYSPTFPILTHISLIH